MNQDVPTVVTGQQIGLLGGPLYTTYKVLGAVYHAKQLNGRAVYWLETNDADFNEINHIDYPDANGNLQTLTWDIPTQGYSCGYIEVDGALVQIIEKFFKTIPRTEHTSKLKRLALGAYAEGTNLAEASQQLARELFGHLDIQFFTPFDPPFRQFSQDILRKEALRTADGEQCNCFCMVGMQRKALFRKGRCFKTRDNMHVDIRKYQLVPNVRTRSVCQDAYFNTHTYIAGPGEVKYLAQMKPNYQFHRVQPANVQPRMSIALIEPKTKRLLKKTGLTLEDIHSLAREELLKKTMTDETGFDAKTANHDADQLTRRLLESMENHGAPPADLKNLRKLLQTEIKKIFGQVRAREKEKIQKNLENAGSLSDLLVPFGKRQERVFNIFHYMNLYGGTGLIDHIYHHYDPHRTLLELTP